MGPLWGGGKWQMMLMLSKKEQVLGTCSVRKLSKANSKV